MRDKIYGLILGNAIGDAMGISTEFMRENEAACRYGFRYLEYSDIVSDRHRGRFRRGDFTDDTDQMLLILNNLIKYKLQPNILEFADDLLRWANTGAAEFGDNVGWGIGATVSAVIETPYFLQDPHKAAKDMWEKAKRGPAANGAVMRTSVLGAPYFWDSTKVASQTLDFCLVTHADHRCQASCVATTLAISSILAGRDDVGTIVAECHQNALLYIEKDNEKEEFSDYLTKFTLSELQLGDSPKIGYTLKTVGSAFWAFKNAHLGFRIAMMRIFQQGGDADTNGAVAGALLGCLLGYTKIPKSWIDNLIHKDYLLQQAEHLCQLMGL
jgi:ADP-ribosylglycohydrolase